MRRTRLDTVGPVKVGIGLPNGGAAIRPTDLVRLAVGAEEIGLDSVWVVDRWLRPHAPVDMPGVPVPVVLPVEYYRSVYDPIDLLTYVAARTEHLELGTSAINVLYHPPVLLARRLATLDQLSAGRLIAGVTSGWMTEEFTVAGVPRGRMGGGFNDHLAAMRAVWGPDPVSHHGPRYTIPLSDIGPKPPRPTIPLLVGYNTEAGLRRAARIGDGLHPYRNDLAQLADDIRRWRATGAELGRDLSTQPIVLRVAADLGEGSGAATREAFTGPVDRWADDLAAAAELGVAHVLLQFPPGTDPDRTLECVEGLARR